MNFVISIWESYNLVLEKGICNVIEMYMIYIFNIFFNNFKFQDY